MNYSGKCEHILEDVSPSQTVSVRVDWIVHVEEAVGLYGDLLLLCSAWNAALHVYAVYYWTLYYLKWPC